MIKGVRLRISTFQASLLGLFCAFGMMTLLASTKCGLKFLKWASRQAVIQFDGVVDFNEYHNKKCFIANGLKRDLDYDSYECDICENFDKLQYFYDNGSHFDVNKINANLRTKSPFVVRQQSFKEQRKISVETWIADILSNERLSYFHPCQYQSNWKSKALDHWGLLRMLQRKEVMSYYVLWENCADIALKEFRQYYQRPKFLAPNVQLTGSNWAMICSNFRGRRYREIELFDPLVIVMVQTGLLEVNLEPLSECEDVCSSLSLSLNTADVLVFSSTLYRLTVLPMCKDNETIVTGVGGFAD